MTENPLRQSLSVEQLRLVEVPYQALRTYGDWPVVDYVIGTLAQEGIDFYSVLGTMPVPCQNYGFLHTSHHGPPQRSDVIGVTLAGLAQLDDAISTIDLTLILIRGIASQYADLPLDPRSVKELSVSWVQIARLLEDGHEPLHLSAVNEPLAVLAAEPCGWGASVLGKESGSQTWDVNASIANFEGVTDLGDYLDRVHRMLGPRTPNAATPSPSAVMSEPPATELDAEIELSRLRHNAPGEYLARVLGETRVDRLITALDSAMSAESLLVGSRWSQLETYLRLLVYLQLKALLGPNWTDPITKQTINRAERAGAFEYMPSPDDGHLLSHLDVGSLFDLIDTYWEQCSPGIGLSAKVWQGRVEELRPVRHRIAHCRRPHPDDVERLEQVLRDLEPAANRMLRYYVDWNEVNSSLDDPVIDDWINLKHDVAHRLVPHGRANKGIYLHLMASRLPWAETGNRITGQPGWFWVMFVSFDHPRHLYIDEYLGQQPVRALLPLIGHIIQPSPWTVAVTIPAVNESAAISDTLASYFEATFLAAHAWSVGNEDIGVRHPWRRHAAAEDPRVDASGLLAILSGLNDDDPLSIFGAR